MAKYQTMTVAFYRKDSDDAFYICEMLQIPRVGDYVQIKLVPDELIAGKVIEVDWGLDFSGDNENGFQVVHIYIDA